MVEKDETVDFWETLCYMAHWFPNSSIFNIEKMGLRQFMEARKHMITMIKASRPASNGHRSFVEQQLEEILNNPQKLKEFTDTPETLPEQ